MLLPGVVGGWLCGVSIGGCGMDDMLWAERRGLQKAIDLVKEYKESFGEDEINEILLIQGIETILREAAEEMK